MNQVSVVIVRAGQVWQDRDRRSQNDPRFIEIVEVSADGLRVRGKSSKGPTTWIKAARFKPKNYKLVKDVEIATGVGTVPPSTPPVQ